MKNTLFNQRGTSLINVLVAGGIGAIVLSGVTTMITDVFKSQRAAQSRDAQRELNSSMRQLLTDPAICTASFGGGDPTVTGFTKTQIIDAAIPSNVKYQTGENYLNNLIVITGFEVKNYVVDNSAVNPRIGKAELDIKTNKLGSIVGSTQMVTTLFLQTILDSANKISSCYALGLADSLWQLSPTNMADIYYSGGNVGIGTTSPSTMLQVDGGALRISNTGVNSGSVDILGGLDGAGSSSIYIKKGTGSINTVLNDSTYNSYINALAGNLGIGTTTPQYPLTVYGSQQSGGNVGTMKIDSLQTETALHISNSTVNGNDWLLLGTGTGSSFGLGNFEIGLNNGGIFQPYFTIANTGNVGIGTINPGYTLDVNGSARATGSVSAWSDIRAKKNIERIENSLDKISKINGVTFDWRTDEFPDKKFKATRDMGIIAQEVEKVFPEVVATAPDGYKSVAYPSLVAPLIEALKELYSKFTSDSSDKERRISSLEAENAELKAKVEFHEIKIEYHETESTQIKARADKAEKENAEIKERLERVEKALRSK